MPATPKEGSNSKGQESPSAWRIRARKLKEREDHDTLLQLSKERLENQPGDTLASAYLGYALAAKGQPEVALRALATAAPDPLERIHVMLARSKLFHDQGQESESIAVLDEALAAMPSDPSVIRAVIHAHTAAHRALAAIRVAHILIDVSPEDVSSWRALCETAMGVGHYAEAVEAAGKVLVLDPDDSVVARYQALSLSRLGFTGQAAHELHGHLQNHGTDKEGWHDLGLIQANNGEIPAAIESFHRARELDPNDARSCVALGIALAKVGKDEEALEALKRACDLGDNSAATQFNLGVVLERLGRTEEALDAYDRALALEEGYQESDFTDGAPPPLHIPSALNKGIILAKAGKLEEATQQLERALESNPHSLQVLFNLASVYYVKGEYQKSYATFRRLLHHDPFDVDGWKMRGEALARSLGMDAPELAQWIAKGEELLAKRSYVEAHECFRRAMDLDPNSARAKERRSQTLAAVYQIPAGDAGAWIRTSRMLLELRLLSDAVDALSVLFSLRPHDPDGRVLVGRILYSLGRFNQSAKQADLALKQDPFHIAALVLKGESLLSQNIAAEALEAFDVILTKSPNDPMAITMKGIALCKLQRGEEGLQMFDRAIELDPQHRDAWYQKGVELERLGRYESAVEAFVQGFQ